jgi:hypothetical protein
MRRFWKLALLAMLLVGITFFYPLLAPIHHRIEPAHFQLIRDGMTLQQVEAILGAPPGEYGAKSDGRIARHLLPTMYDAQQIAAWRQKLSEIARQRDGRPSPELEYLLPMHPPPLGVDWQRVRTWASPRGTISVGLGQEDRIYLLHSSTDVRIVPPWQDWWNRYWKK